MTIWSPAMDAGTPKYLALADAIERDVYAGALRPGERLPTQRDLADTLGVNVSTVTRGYSEAERRGLVAATVGRGTFVASDASVSVSLVSLTSPVSPTTGEPSAPGLIEMGLCTPLYGLDPDLAGGLRNLTRRRDVGALLHYAPPGGSPAHRETGAAWARRYGLEAAPEEVVVCAGSQHGLTCCLGALFSPGDRIAACGLTYPGMKTLASMMGIRLTPIAQDGQGMRPESLDATCRREDVRGVYLVPGVHNPTAARMGAARRKAIAEIARRHDLTIIEDDAYALSLPSAIPPGAIPPDATRPAVSQPGAPPPVAGFAPERAVYLAGVSKAFGAGLRVAYAVAPAAMARKLAQAVLNTVWMAPPLNAELASLWINDGTADRIVAAKRAELVRRNTLAAEVLARRDFSAQPSGFLLWLRLPEPWTGAIFEAHCRAAGVNVFGAERFAVGDTPAPPAARISISAAPTLDDLRRGLEILKDVMDRGPDQNNVAGMAML